MFETFYNESIRNTVIAFGSLFNEIYVVRKNSDGIETSRFKVPISYGPKEKFIRMLDEYSRLKGNESGQREISTILPRIGFNIEAINYDSERKRNTLSKRYSRNTDSNKVSFEYAEIPYNIDFMLSVASRTMEDALQIVEQILAYFTPEFTVTINFTDTRTKIDVPITLTSVQSEIDFEGDLSSQRSIIFNMGFTVRTYVYGPTKTSKVIKTVDARFFLSDLDAETNAVTGTTGALSRQFVGVTGPSGLDTDLDNYSVYGDFGSTGSTTERANTIFEYPDTLDITGATL